MDTVPAAADTARSSRRSLRRSLEVGRGWRQGCSVAAGAVRPLVLHAQSRPLEVHKPFIMGWSS